MFHFSVIIYSNIVEPHPFLIDTFIEKFSMVPLVEGVKLLQKETRQLHEQIC